MMSRLSAFAIGVAAIVGCPAVAFAQAPQGVSPAQALFDQGVADMEAGRYEKACPAIQASQRMEPMPGTLFTLAECEAKRGRSATALRYYSEYLALYSTFTFKKKLEQKDRAETSEEQRKRLEVLVPRLTLVLPSGNRADVVVKRDGEVVAELSLGTAIPVDPGDHLVTTQVAGFPEREHRISLVPGQSKTLELTVLREAEVSTPGPLAPTGLPAPPPPPDLRPWRIGTLSAGILAVAGLAVGAVTGILAIEQREVVNRNCESDGACNPVGLEAVDRVRTFGSASTIGFVGGGVGVATTITLILVTPSLPTSSSTVGNTPSLGAISVPFGMQVAGSF